MTRENSSRGGQVVQNGFLEGEGGRGREREGFTSAAATTGAGTAGSVSESWQEELRSLFPNVNISFGSGGEGVKLVVGGLSDW